MRPLIWVDSRDHEHDDDSCGSSTTTSGSRIPKPTKAVTPRPRLVDEQETAPSKIPKPLARSQTPGKSRSAQSPGPQTQPLGGTAGTTPRGGGARLSPSSGQAESVGRDTTPRRGVAAGGGGGGGSAVGGRAVPSSTTVQTRNSEATLPMPTKPLLKTPRTTPRSLTPTPSRGADAERLPSWAQARKPGASSSAQQTTTSQNRVQSASQAAEAADRRRNCAAPVLRHSPSASKPAASMPASDERLARTVSEGHLLRSAGDGSNYTPADRLARTASTTDMRLARTTSATEIRQPSQGTGEVVSRLTGDEVAKKPNDGRISPGRVPPGACPAAPGGGSGRPLAARRPLNSPGVSTARRPAAGETRSPSSSGTVGVVGGPQRGEAFPVEPARRSASAGALEASPGIRSPRTPASSSRPAAFTGASSPQSGGSTDSTVGGRARPPSVGRLSGKPAPMPYGVALAARTAASSSRNQQAPSIRKTSTSGAAGHQAERIPAASGSGGRTASPASSSMPRPNRTVVTADGRRSSRNEQAGSAAQSSVGTAASATAEGVVPLLQQIVEENAQLREGYAEAQRRLDQREEERRLRTPSCFHDDSAGGHGQCNENYQDQSENLFDRNFDLVNSAFQETKKSLRGSPPVQTSGQLLTHHLQKGPEGLTMRLDDEDVLEDELAGQSVFLDSPDRPGFREVRAETKAEFRWGARLAEEGRKEQRSAGARLHQNR